MNRRFTIFAFVSLSAVCFSAALRAEEQVPDPSSAETPSDKDVDARPGDARWNEAFEDGLGGSHEDDFTLFTVRFGHHWTFEGRDRTGKAVFKLTCLLCTEEEALSSAAFLGKEIRRQAEGASTPREEVDSTSAAYAAAKVAASTVSIDGTVVPPYSPKKKVDDIQMRDTPTPPTERSTRIRLAAASACVGVSAAVIGGLFWWMDGNCANENCSKLHSLKGPAIGLIVSSALLETAAVVLFSVKRRKGGEK